MKYLALDIETSAIDPKEGQILQIAAYVDDLRNPVPRKDLPAFNAFIHHDKIYGTPEALAMNAWILNKPKKEKADLRSTYIDLRCFISDHLGPHEKVTVAGKNVAGFDIKWLEYHKPSIQPYATQATERFRHRALDVGPLYLELHDDCVPSLALCKTRAGFETATITHDARDDAWDVVQLVRKALVPLYEIEQGVYYETD